MTSEKPDITLYFLAASRAIRIAWLLEELALPYTLVSSPRAPDNLAPAEFKAKIPATLKKSPTIKDGDLVVQESGAIVEYLCEKYDRTGRLLPKEPHARTKVLQWIHASEGTFMVHALPVLYARLHMPEAARPAYLREMEQGLAVNVRKDLDWLEGALKSGGEGSFLLGDEVTAADVVLQFSIQVVQKRKLGVEDLRAWPGVEAWLKATEECEGYKRAVQKTGYSLE